MSDVPNLWWVFLLGWIGQALAYGLARAEIKNLHRAIAIYKRRARRG